MDKYSLIGVDGNAFSVIGYVQRALKKEGLKEEADRLFAEATTGNYAQLLCICQKYLDMANERTRERSIS